jgi:hypothetical protein
MFHLLPPLPAPLDIKGSVGQCWSMPFKEEGNSSSPTPSHSECKQDLWLHQLACNGKTAKRLPHVECWSRIPVLLHGYEGTLCLQRLPNARKYPSALLSGGETVRGFQDPETSISHLRDRTAECPLLDGVNVQVLFSKTPRMLNALRLKQSRYTPTRSTTINIFLRFTRFESFEGITEAICSARYHRNICDSIHA